MIEVKEYSYVGGGVLERRIHWGPGLRIYFGRDGDALIILLGGGTKRRQQVDITNAQDLWLDYKRRKREGRYLLGGVSLVSWPPVDSGVTGPNYKRDMEKHLEMPLTRDFKETVQARVQSDPEFRRALLKESVESLLEGDVDTGRAVLRDYINATIGFEALGQLTGKPPKSLMRMFGPAGNPQARNLFEVINHLQQREGIRLEVKAVR